MEEEEVFHTTAPVEPSTRSLRQRSKRPKYDYSEGELEEDSVSARSGETGYFSTLQKGLGVPDSAHLKARQRKQTDFT